MFALGFLVAGRGWSRARFEELGKPVDWAYEMVFAALVGGLVGARLWWIAENWAEAQDDLFGSLFSGSGLVWYGGALGGALGVLAWARCRDWLDLQLLDVARRPAGAGYAIGRIGCQLSGDGDYGIAVGRPVGDGVSRTARCRPTEEVHPTPVYETLAMGLVALLLWRWRDRWRPGMLFALYLVLAGLERFLVEFVRRNDDVLARPHPAAAGLDRDDGGRRRSGCGALQPPRGAAPRRPCRAASAPSHTLPRAAVSRGLLGRRTAA